MGFFSDLFEGNFGNLWHDITADPVAEIGLGTAAVLGTGGLLAPELLGAGAAGGLGGLFGAGEAAAGGTGLAASALGGAELGGTAAGVDISSLLASGAAGGAGAAGAGSDTALALTAPETSPTASAGLPSEITSGASAGANDAQIDQILSTAKGQVASLPDAGGEGDIFSRLVTGAGKQITNNPIGLAAGGAGLVGSLLQGTKSSGPAQDALKAEAPVLQQQGNQLQSYLSAGTLPPALQAQLDQQIQAAKARIIANHAAQGRSTDPAQNSALAQELNNVDLQATALKAKTETDLYQQGMQDIQLSAELNTQLANFDRQDQKAVTDALTNFAKAMTPSAGGIQLKLN